MDALATLDRPFTARDVDRLESAFLAEPQVDCPVSHHFGPGVYIREVVMPAGAYVIGHSHKDEHFNILLEGRLTLIREDGTRMEMAAPQTFVGSPGRKIAYIHETTRWQNVYATTETDVSVLEERLFDRSDAFEDAKGVKLLCDQSGARADFQDAIALYGFTPERVQEISEDESDMVPLPFGEYKFTTAPSPIHGKGLFATGNYAAGELVAVARLDGKRTLAGRFTNHSDKPNAEMFLCDDGNIYLLATAEICGCGGGMVGEEITIDYRQALSLSLGVH